MEELIRLIADSNITWASAAVLIAFFLRGVPDSLIGLNKLRIETKAALEQNRIDAEKDQTRVLNSLRDELITSREINTQLKTTVSLIPPALDAMRRQADRLHSDVQTVPDEVWRIGDPKLDTMKEDLERKIHEVQTSIVEALPKEAEIAREIIMGEFQDMRKRLEELAETVATFKVNSKTNTKHDQPSEDITKRTA